MPSQQTVQLVAGWPPSGEPHIKISVGACHLKVTPGEKLAWVSGTYEDPTGGLESKIVQEGDSVRVSQKTSLSRFKTAFSGAPRMELKLGDKKPYHLTLEGGASNNSFELGGLPVTGLTVRQGAGKSAFDFSEPNPGEMGSIDIDTGAVSLSMRNLANANFAEMRMNGGASSYEFDFGGELKRDANVRIDVGMAAVRISVPATTAAKITPNPVIGGLDVGDGFTKQEGAFWTRAAVDGKTPVLTIAASVTLGSLSFQLG
ncbi:MAG: hypothetical protein WC828_00470 [Thermoleophilia bacterium]|jgi:hypothetical protein